ncbi:MAG TPA: hypothetical protein VHY33_15715 [Thermoanaerobaculia bacterium]|jgi:hypothetical protein|nr:hypothetical protein [Thermoanaerobaculia bacterium]
MNRRTAILAIVMLLVFVLLMLNLQKQLVKLQQQRGGSTPTSTK